ncbi:MAG: DeoR/GlpR family DNA-binding transcription regulator [Pleomorphochaeta sp.]
MKQSIVEVKKRQQALLTMFEAQNDIKVKDASEILGVSELTIRRDFEMFQSKGVITRYHGGAKLVSETRIPAPKYKEKNNLNLNQKIAIAKIASSYIKDNDTLFINAGTTTYEILKIVIHLPITILTNNAAISELSSDKDPAKVIYTGGEYNPANKSLSGNLVELMIRKMTSSICILGVNGISSVDGLTTAYYPETIVNEAFLNRSKGLKIVVADGSKLGKSYGFASSDLSSIDVLITDETADKNEISKIEQSGVEVVIA